MIPSFPCITKNQLPFMTLSKVLVLFVSVPLIQKEQNKQSFLSGS